MENRVFAREPAGVPAGGIFPQPQEGNGGDRSQNGRTQAQLAQEAPARFQALIRLCRPLGRSFSHYLLLTNALRVYSRREAKVRLQILLPEREFATGELAIGFSNLLPLAKAPKQNGRRRYEGGFGPIRRIRTYHQV